MIPTRHLLVECEVFLDDSGAERDCSKRDRRTQGVIAESHRYIKAFLQRRHIPQMNRVVFRRIDRNTMQQHDLFVAFGANGFNGLLDLRRE